MNIAKFIYITLYTSAYFFCMALQADASTALILNDAPEELTNNLEATGEFNEFSFFDDSNYNVPISDFKNGSTNSKIADIIAILVGPEASVLPFPIRLDNILKQYLYTATNPINDRSLHDIPSLSIRGGFGVCDHCQFGVRAFYNQTLKHYFTKRSPHLGDYLAFSGALRWGPEIDLLEMLQMFVEDADAKLGPGASLKLPTILDLFAPISLQERRVGGMFGFRAENNDLSLTIQAPLYYIERNFFLTHDEQEAIKNAPLFQLFDDGSDNGNDDENDDDSDNEDADDDSEDDTVNVEEFMKQHLVNDKFGIGDTRISLMWRAHETEKMAVFLGGQVTLPTCITFKDHLIGTSFPRKPKQPPFNFVIFDELREDFNVDGLLDYATNLGITALDRITRITTNTSLGSDHTTVGGIIKCEMYPTSNLTFEQQLQIKYHLPHNAIRFCRLVKNDSDYNRDYGLNDPTNEALAQDSLDFLVYHLIETLCPGAYTVTLRPGCTIDYYALAKAQLRKCVVTIGYDYWHRTAEQFDIIDKDVPKKYMLDTAAARRPSAEQHKIFCTLDWDIQRQNYHWTVGLFGDFTFANKGIGRDWTAGLRWSITN